MSLRVRFQFDPGRTIGYSVERLRDGLFFDFLDGSFKPAPIAPIMPLPENGTDMGGKFAGQYKATLAPTSGYVFTDGDYCVSIHDQSVAPIVVLAVLGATMHRGDDATVFPAAAVAATPAKGS